MQVLNDDSLQKVIAKRSLKELINGHDSFKTDAIGFCDYRFIVLVLTGHYLPT
jgi:hypothetical protein